MPSLRAFLVVALFATASLALTAPQATALADHLLTQVGRTAGIAELPRAGDGQLALALLQRSRMVVHAMAAQVSEVTTVRALLEPTGLFGERAYAEVGTPVTVPFTDNYVDLLVITNVADADLGAIPVAEVVRALCPGGKAYVGRATVEGAGITIAALNAWVSGRSDAAVTTDAQGTWAVITKREPHGTDVWRHSLHGADNNPFAADSVAKWPFLPQWRSKPYSGMTRHGNTVAAGGRLYCSINQGNGDGNLYLRAYRIWNGEILWTRSLGNYQSWENPTMGSFMVAADNSMYLAVGNRVEELNGETGSLVRTITMDPAANSRVKWIALDGGGLYALTGDTALDSLGDNGWSKYFNGTRIVAWDTASHSERWVHTEAGRIDSRDIGVVGGRVIFFARGTRVAALNTSNAGQVWENRDAAVVALLESYMGGDTYWPVGSASGFLCSQWGVFVCQPEDGRLAALSYSDGSLLWQATRDGNRSQAKVLLGNGILLSRNILEADKRAWNVTTGQTVAALQNISLGGGCGLITADWDGVFGNAGGQSHSFSLSRNLGGQPFKTDCGISMIVSNGLAVNPNNTGCTCPPNRGMVVEAPAGSFTFDRTAVQAERLEPGPAAGNLVVQVVPDSLDWPMHRANLGRTAASKATLPSTWQLIWSSRRTYPYDSVVVKCNDATDALNTPPVTAGDLAFWAGSDGVVRCFSPAAQRELWSYPTGGRIATTPTVYDGCVYVGSADGYAYCIEAHTGRLVWRFRAAPLDRRINYFGSLASIWPVNSGVLVRGDTAYFAAGFSESYGTHVYAVNAKTGAVIWQNNASATLYSSQDRSGVVPCGYLTIAGNKLWLRSLHGRNGIYDAATGVVEPLPAALSGRNGGPTTRGAEIGMLDANHVVFGGRYQFMDHDERQVNYHTHYDLLRLDAAGSPMYAEVSLLNTSTQNAWDSQDFFTATWGPSALERWSVSALTGFVDSAQAAHSNPADYQWWQEFAARADWNGSSAATPLAQWRIGGLDMNAIAVARNALVVTSCTKANQWDPQANWQWYLLVLARNTVDTLWQVRLPGIPLHGGVAITHRGDVVVTMRSGAVLCYGETPVSVALPSRLAPAAPAALGVARVEPVVTERPTVHAAPATGSPQVGLRAAPVALSLGGEPAVAGATVAGTPACRTSTQSALRCAAGEETRRHYGRSTTWQPDLPCLAPVSVSASSTAGVNAAARTLDRDLATRWAPSAAGRQSLTYDLGQRREVSAVSLVWYSLRRTSAAFAIELSLDGKHFVRVDAGQLTGRATGTLLRSFVPSEARYVRVSLEGGSVSLYEVGIHGTGVCLR